MFYLKGFSSKFKLNILLLHRCCLASFVEKTCILRSIHLRNLKAFNTVTLTLFRYSISKLKYHCHNSQCV